MAAKRRLSRVNGPPSKRRRIVKRKRRSGRNALSRPLRSLRVRSIPDRMFVTLKYNDRFKINPGIGTIAVHRFSLNSCHDPDITGTGHQPRYWDQLCNNIEGNGLYHKYKTHACSFSIKMLNTDVASAVQTFVIATPHGNTVTSVDDPDAVLESTRCMSKVLGGRDGGKSFTMYNGKLMVKAVEGVRNLDDPNYDATYGNSPNWQPQLAIGALALDEADDPDDIECEITLYYKVELFDRIFKSSVN